MIEEPPVTPLPTQSPAQGPRTQRLSPAALRRLVAGLLLVEALDLAGADREAA